MGKTARVDEPPARVDEPPARTESRKDVAISAPPSEALELSLAPVRTSKVEEFRAQAKSLGDARFVVTEPNYEAHLYMRFQKLWDDVFDDIMLVTQGEDLAPYAYWELMSEGTAVLFAIAGLSSKPEHSARAMITFIRNLENTEFEFRIPVLLHQIDRVINEVELGPKKKPETSMFDIDVDAIMRGHWKRIEQTPIPVRVRPTVRRFSEGP